MSLKKFNYRKFFKPQADEGCSGNCSASCPADEKDNNSRSHTVLDKNVNRRQALGLMAGGAAAGSALLASGFNMMGGARKGEKALLKWEEYFKGNYRLMTDKEKAETVERLEKLACLEEDLNVKIKTTPPRQKVLLGYAFNISKCRGYRHCVEACIKENNQDRDSKMQYIRIFEMKNGNINLEEGKADYFHQVPSEGHFFLGTQCFQCAKPPCVDVCPVGATWKEKDGIVVIDYDWCIGCRYCAAACPYWARRFNWQKPSVAKEKVNKSQHYLSNRLRPRGTMEKCTYCLQRSREGRHPACVEACPTGARIFGNLLDHESEIRYIIQNKKVFRLKEDLGTEPKFWYFMD